jgi:hypothetical protein
LPLRRKMWLYFLVLRHRPSRIDVPTAAAQRGDKTLSLPHRRKKKPASRLPRKQIGKAGGINQAD